MCDPMSAYNRTEDSHREIQGSQMLSHSARHCPDLCKRPSRPGSGAVDRSRDEPFPNLCLEVRAVLLSQSYLFHYSGDQISVVSILSPEFSESPSANNLSRNTCFTFVIRTDRRESILGLTNSTRTDAMIFFKPN